MGNQSGVWRWSLSLAVALPLFAVFVLPSCEDNRSGSRVSSGLFLAAIPSRQFNSAAGPSGFRVLLDRIDILSPIDPDRFPSEVAQLQSSLFVLNDLERRDGAASELLVYDQQSRSVLTVDTCQNPQDCLNRPAGFQPVRLNYSVQGLGTEQNRPQVGISTTVLPVRLANGWILAFDNNTRNIIGFKNQEPVPVIDDNGQPQMLPYRTTLQKANPNFGRGNGMLLSVVISGEALRDEVGANTVTRLQPIGDKVMVFFSTVPAIHVLELREEATLVDFDLANQTQTGYDVIEVSLLKGRVQFFPADPANPNSPLSRPFVSSATIANLVGNPVVDVDEFQPVTIPTDGSVLIFERQTSNFVRVVEIPNGGAAFVGIRQDVLLRALRETAGVIPADADLSMGSTFRHPNRTEICIMEENTNNIIAYDYTADIFDNVRVAYPSTEVQAPRDISQRPDDVAAVEPTLAFADSNVRDNWLAFEFGRDEILSVNLTSPAIGVSAKRRDIIAVTFDTLVSVPRVIPLDDNNVRLLDTESVSLIEMKLEYSAFPIRIEN